MFYRKVAPLLVVLFRVSQIISPLDSINNCQ